MKGLAAGIGGSVLVGGYAVAEPWRLLVTRYRLSPPGWPAGLKLRIAALADLHACDPWMTEARIRQIVARTNALAPDVVCLLGDYVASDGMLRLSRPTSHIPWASALADLSAPLGVHAVLGNHDWWSETGGHNLGRGPIEVRRLLEAAGIPVYENDAVRLEHAGQPFWLAGLGDQWTHWSARRRHERIPYEGVDDLPATLAKIADSAPVVLMVHEPDIFPAVPDRVSLTLAGHTHGGQVRLLGYAPIVPSQYGSRYAYGHIVEHGRNLIVSGGLGCSGLPLRIGSPPEIVVVELGGNAAPAA